MASMSRETWPVQWSSERGSSEPHSRGSLTAQGLSPSRSSDNDPGRWGATIAGLAESYLPPRLRPCRPIIVASKFVKDIVAGLR